MLDVSPERLLRSIFQTIAYADIFDYPLTADEVYRYLTAVKVPRQEVDQALMDPTFFAKVGEFFTFRGREQIVELRKQRAKIATRLWPKAVRYGRIIASIPFVRMVAVTGSLSMNNADEGKDVDYLLVTAPNHLWTCRALSLLVARLARLEGVNLCPNYLVTTNALELTERSLYVAHELAQMIPLSGIDIYCKMRCLNGWVEDYLPNAISAPELSQSVMRSQKYPFLQRIFEFLFYVPFASWFEKWEMNRKIAKLTQEQSSSPESYFSIDVCKGHIDRHKQKAENTISEKMEERILGF